MFKVKLERDGKTVWIVLRDRPEGQLFKWGSGKRWTVVEVTEARS